MTNYHQHTTYCDGHDSMRQVVQTAVEKGFSAIGISSHAPLIIKPCQDPILSYDWLMDEKNLAAYIKEAHQLRDEFKDRIKVFLGLEADYFDDEHSPAHWKPYGLDYVVGSIHFLPSKNHHCSFLQFDSAGRCAALLLEEYGGPEGFYKACFQQNIRMIKTGSIDILGHMDLFNKINQHDELFNRADPKYLSAAQQVFAAAMENNVVVEINTGYMARKGFAEPFPNYRLIEIGAKMGVHFCMNSDCHYRQDMDFAFKEVREKIKTLGVKELYTLQSPGKWEAKEL